MGKLDFIQQARWIQQERHYSSRWPYIVFKGYFGVWPGPLLKEGDPRPPTQEFLEWVDEYQRAWLCGTKWP